MRKIFLLAAIALVLATAIAQSSSADCLIGDADCDGSFTDNDSWLIEQSIGTNVSPSEICRYDATGDGKIDETDKFKVLRFVFGLEQQTQRCSSYTTAFCGNNAVEASENCDSDNLANLTCQDFGYTAGTLRCSADCKSYDFLSCVKVCEGDECEIPPEDQPEIVQPFNLQLLCNPLVDTSCAWNFASAFAKSASQLISPDITERFEAGGLTIECRTNGKCTVADQTGESQEYTLPAELQNLDITSDNEFYYCLSADYKSRPIDVCFSKKILHNADNYKIVSTSKCVTPTSPPAEGADEVFPATYCLSEVVTFDNGVEVERIQELISDDLTAPHGLDEIPEAE